MSKHEEVSSDEFEELELTEDEKELHGEVSSEGGSLVEEDDALEVEDFEGVSAGELEQVAAFDESYALGEGDVTQEVAVTKTLAALPPCWRWNSKNQSQCVVGMTECGFPLQLEFPGDGIAN